MCHFCLIFKAKPTCHCNNLSSSVASQSQNHSGWKGTHTDGTATFCSKQSLHQVQTRFLRSLARWVCKTCKKGFMEFHWATCSYFAYRLVFPLTVDFSREPGSMFSVTTMQVLPGCCQVPPRPFLLQAAQSHLPQPLL